MCKTALSRTHLRQPYRSFRCTRSWLLPEGPEVAVLTEALADQFSASITPWSLTHAKIVSGRYANHGPPEGWDKLVELLPVNVDRIQSRGKFIYFDLNSPLVPHLSLWSTLGLSGGWTLRPNHKTARLALTLEQGSRVEHLYFYDSRNFGTAKVCFDASKLADKLKKLGPSWLDQDAGVPLETFQALMGRKGKVQQKRPLCKFLMDQTKQAA
jgi:formamidopyrimidine-DNA glycosylase